MQKIEKEMRESEFIVSYKDNHCDKDSGIKTYRKSERAGESLRERKKRERKRE